MSSGHKSNVSDYSHASRRAEMLSFSDLRTCRLTPGYYLMLMRQREKDRAVGRKSFIGQFQRVKMALAD